MELQSANLHHVKAITLTHARKNGEHGWTRDLKVLTEAGTELTFTLHGNTEAVLNDLSAAEYETAWGGAASPTSHI